VTALARGHTIELTTPDGSMPCYEVRPDAPAGAVIVVQEAFGVNDYVEDVARRFAAEGYLAVAPHLFHRAGGGTAPYGDFAKVLPLFEGLTDDGILIDVDATIEHLRAAGHGDDAIGVVGFCFGGRVTFLVATTRRLGAAVGFYGGGIVTPRFPQFPALVDRGKRLATPWLGLFGDRDESIPVDDVERLRTALAEAPVAAEVVRYPEAGHGFHCDQRNSYDATVAADGWRRTIGWLERHLARPVP
jgi:carboxymethylenebutenolidase